MCCSHGRRGFFGGLASVLVHAGQFRLLYKGGLGLRRQQEHERWCEGVDESEMGKRQFILVVGGNTVGAWLLLVIAIMCWVGMEVVGRENAGLS